MPELIASKLLGSRELVAPDRRLGSRILTTRQIELAPNVSRLRAFQIEGVHWLRAHRRALLADEMGLGKSAQVLRALPRGGRTIIVCPAGLRLMWRDQIEDWRPDLRVRIVRAGGDAGELLPRPGEVVITNYEGLPDPISKRVLVRGYLADVVVIFDEAHYLQNPEADRTVRARALARQARIVWAMTATPMLGTPGNLWGVLETCGLHRRAFGSWAAFVELFGGRRRRGGVYEWTATEGELAELLERFAPTRAALARVMLRRRKADVLPELPSKIYETIPVELEATPQADAAWKAFVNAKTLPPLEDLSEARAELARLKIPAMLEVVRAREDAGIPLLVFSAHVPPIEALERREGWGTITGSTPEREMHATVARFQSAELRGLGLTIQKGGVGINLTRAAHELFVSLAYTPALNEQAEDRPNRFGQVAKAIHVARLVADHPLDRRMFEILGAKESRIAAVIG
jgi:SNF2 family DNA or RNA helicase